MGVEGRGRLLSLPPTWLSFQSAGRGTISSDIHLGADRLDWILLAPMSIKTDLTICIQLEWNVREGTRSWSDLRPRLTDETYRWNNFNNNRARNNAERKFQMMAFVRPPEIKTKERREIRGSQTKKEGLSLWRTLSLFGDLGRSIGAIITKARFWT